jgi:hypothetical protein
MLVERRLLLAMPLLGLPTAGELPKVYEQVSIASAQPNCEC